MRELHYGGPLRFYEPGTAPCDAGCFAFSDVMKNAVWITSGHTALNMM